MKDIRFGSIPEEYQKDGETKTSWQPAGYKAVIDWDAKKLFVIDARTGKMIVFNEQKEKPDLKTHKRPAPQTDIGDMEVPF